MDASTLAKVMTIEGHKVTYSKTLNRLYFDKAYGGPSFKASDWMAALNTALIRAHCTTAKRVQMFVAQLGAESGSFRYTEELASGAEYNWRSDLGNIYAGDGQRFKGRTYIQITGRHNYAALSKWAHSKGYVPTATYFVDHPTALADVKYIFLGPVWYWIVARNMNSYADNNDIVGATRAVNGGLNNLAGRRERWLFAKQFGNALLPTGVKPVAAHPTPTPAKPAPKPATTYKTYTVRSGDTLSSIAAKYHTSWLLPSLSSTSPTPTAFSSAKSCASTNKE
jgi:predicted chitinase